MFNKMKSLNKNEKSKSAQPLIQNTLFGIVSVFFSLHAFANTELASLPSVNTTIEVSSGAEKLNGVDLAVEKLSFLIEKKIYPALPSDIADELKGHPLKIILKEDFIGDEFFTPAESNPNQLEIYLKPSLLGTPDGDALIVHAYFHAIQYLVHPDPDQETWEKENWLREGMAQYFEYLILKRLSSSHVIAAFHTPGTSLTGTYPSDHLIPELYGHDLLYFYYLVRECGQANLFWKLTRSEPGKYGSDTIDAAIAGSNLLQCTSFEQSAVHFEIARILNKHSYSGQNSNIHFLLDLGAESLNIENTLTPDLLNKLKTSGAYKPFLFAPEINISQIPIARFHRIFIHTTYPYDVSEVPPPPGNSTNWILLVLKK